jgi:uroporphyrinogen decarboxylase
LRDKREPTKLHFEIALTMKRFSFPKDKRLVSNSQFRAVLYNKQRLRFSDRLLTLYMAENDLGYPRLGISIAKSSGNAVVRNRLKRLLREAFRQSQEQIPAGFDYVLMISPGRPKKSQAAAKERQPTFEEIKTSFLTLMTAACRKNRKSPIENRKSNRCSMTPKERIYAIIKGESYDRPAVTPIFMAWAANFVGHTYRDYYLEGDILVKAQLAVTQAFNIDQISAISDPWRESSAYGMEFEYPPDGVGKPKDVLIKSPDDISLVKPLDVESAERTKQRIDSVVKMAEQVGQTHSLLGWVEGPLAEYGDLRGIESTMMDLIDKPEMFVEAGEIIVQNAIAFAVAQLKAGADMIGIGDAAASLVTPDMYTGLVLPLEKRLIEAIHEAGGAVKLHVCGNISNIVEFMPQSGADIIDVDWMVPLARARELVGPDVTLCGNFNPVGVLFEGSPEEVAEEARDCLSTVPGRFILMPGCEVPPATPEENIRAFCPCDGCLIQQELKL